MRIRSIAALLVAQVALGVVALPANAVPIYVNFDTPIASDATGDDGATGSDDGGGFSGGFAVIWANGNVDVTIAPGYTFTGGLGGPGGLDAANDGGNTGGLGGPGFDLLSINGTVTAGGISVSGGIGGDGSDGSAGGANDTVGGTGGVGGYGIVALNDGHQVILTNTLVSGATGGAGGAAGDAAGDAGDDTSGGVGGYGGFGIYTQGVGTIIDIGGSSVVSGGNGGAGGTSLANGANANGGAAGEGIFDLGTNTIITVGAGSIVQGGDGGAAGTGGTGGSAGADASGVWLQGANASLTNYGTILGSDTGMEAAIEIVDDTALIDNYGTIGAASGHSGRGVSLLSTVTLQTFHNHIGGVVQTNGFPAFALVSGSTTNFINEGTIVSFGGGGYAVVISGSVTNFTNSGTIQGANGPGLYLGAPAAPDVIGNTGGLITSAGDGTVHLVGDLGSAGVTFVGGTIANTSGLAAIKVYDPQSGVIGVSDAIIDGEIVFTQPGGETLNVKGSSLDGDVEFAAGTNNVNFLAGGTTTLLANTQFINTTLLDLQAGASVVSNAVQSNANSSIEGLHTTLGSTLTLNEDLWTVLGVLNQGTITIAAGKTLTSTLFNGDGVYTFGVTDASTLGKIEAQGAGSSLDFAGASLQIVLDNPSASFVAGTNFLLAEDLNSNAISGVTNGAVLLDNSALLTFFLYRGDAAEIGQTSDLLFAQVQQALLADIAAEGDDPNSIALGAALDAIGLDGDADIDDLMLALAMLPTNQAINDMLDALLPETDGVAYDIATDAGDQMLDVASRRLDGLRGSTDASLEYRVASLSLLGLRGAADTRARNQFWGQAFGRRVDQSKHSFNEGYDAGSYGFAAGADTALSNATHLGAALSYTTTNADGNGINRTDTDVESYQLTLYGDHLFGNAMYAKGLLAIGWHTNDIARHDVGGIPGNTATGGHDASAFNLRAELGRAYAGGGNLSLIPRATLNAAWYSPDGYSEQGVGGLGLTVTPDDLGSVRLGLGVLARWDVKLSGGELLRPELRLDYRRDLTRERFETTSEFLGAPGIAFRTQGVEPAADILNIGVGALLATAGGVDIRASYDFELKEDYTAHAGYVRASLPF